MLSLNFERARDLPRKMRKEAAKHRWPVAHADAYPWIQHRDEDGDLRPTHRSDVRAIIGAARAVAGYLDALVDPPAEEPLEVPVGEHTVTVGPFPFEEPTLHEVDRVLCANILASADDRFGERLEREVDRAFPDADEALWVGLGIPWLAHELVVEGRRLAEWFLVDQPGLSEEGKAHLEAQHRAWFSAWEVTAVEPGTHLTLVDHLTGEERTVEDREGSRSIPVRATIFGRVLDLEERSLLVAVHERFLGPTAGDAVVQAMRKRLRRKTQVPPERLRDPKTSRALIRLWQDAVAADDERRGPVPILQNTDGDPLLLTEDRFAIVEEHADVVRKRIATLEGILEGPDDDEWSLSRPGNAMHPSWDNTIVAHLELAGGSLRSQSNSIRRADETRSMLEDALGDLVRFQARSHQDPTSAPALEAMETGRGKRPRHEDDPDRSAEMLEALREFKARHYAGWVDQPVPALGGRSPREAAKTKQGKRRVDLLLREMEHHEQAVPPAERFDFGALRRELGL